MPHRRTKQEMMEEKEMYAMREAKPEKKLPAMHLSSRKRYVGEAAGVKKVHEEQGARYSSMAPPPKDHGFKAGKGSMRHDGHQGPQATSIPGMMPVIHDVQRAGKGIHGVPGIISSTTLGPEVRQRLVTGIIEHPMAGEAASGPVHRVAGHDSTAYNEGMVHIAGSRYK